MYEPLSDMKRLVALLLFLGSVPVHAGGQARRVISHELAISQREAVLQLEFSGEDALGIALRDGSVIIDDDVVGGFESGDALDTAWRNLLGEIAPLGAGPLGVALRGWDVPTSLRGADSDVARLMDQALEEALGPVETIMTPNQRTSVNTDTAVPDVGRILQALFNRSDILSGLSDAFEDVDFVNSRIRIGEDVLISADEIIEGTMLVIDADITVEGRIEGDVVVVEGSIRVSDGGQVTGDIRLVDSRYDGVDESRLDGQVIHIQERIRTEIRNELRNEARDSSLRNSVAGGVADVAGNVMAFLFISLLALGIVRFAKDNLELVADTAQRNPMRAGVVGAAGAFLVLPTWVLGCVALVISLVGIIALPFWILLFPVAVALGAGFGYLAVARNIGEWVAAREISGLTWIRRTNTLYAVVTGVGALVAFYVASNILDIFPFFGFFSGLLITLGTIATVATFLVGFGAVLLTRGGRKAEFYDGTETSFQ